MNTTKMQLLLDIKQSVWLDDLRRGMTRSGELQDLIDGGLSGMTSQVIPTLVSLPSSVTLPTTPTTELSLNNSVVTAGLFRSICPATSASMMFCGNASTSTFSPTDKAVAGLTVLITSCMRSTSVQSCSSPNVSKRKIA